MKKWSVRFRAGPQNLFDDPRQVQTKTLIMIELYNKVDDLVRSVYHVALRINAEKVDVSVETVWTIIHERLG